MPDDGESPERNDEAGDNKVAGGGGLVEGDSRQGLESDTEDEGYEMYDPRYPTD